MNILTYRAHAKIHFHLSNFTSTGSVTTKKGNVKRLTFNITLRLEAGSCGVGVLGLEAHTLSNRDHRSEAEMVTAYEASPMMCLEGTTAKR